MSPFGLPPAVQSGVSSVLHLGEHLISLSVVTGILALAVRIICSYAFRPIVGNMVVAYAESFSWSLPPRQEQRASTGCLPIYPKNLYSLHKQKGETIPVDYSKKLRELTDLTSAEEFSLLYLNTYHQKMDFIQFYWFLQHPEMETPIRAMRAPSVLKAQDEFRQEFFRVGLRPQRRLYPYHRTAPLRTSCRRNSLTFLSC